MEHIKLEKRGEIAIVKIDNPSKLNALSNTLMKNLVKVISDLGKDKKVGVIILTGSGKSFISGGDIKEMSAFDFKKALKFAAVGKLLVSSILDSSKVVISAVNGYALGGGSEVALASDIVVASKKAVFGQPEAKLGVIPGFGGTQLLRDNLSLHLSKELVFRGNIISADEAYRIGLVNHVVDDPLKKSIEIADEILRNSPYAVKEAKKLLNKDLSRNFKEESNVYARCFSNKDSKEGINAFLEKRKPNFNK